MDSFEGTKINFGLNETKPFYRLKLEMNAPDSRLFERDEEEGYAPRGDIKLTKYGSHPAEILRDTNAG